MSPPHPDHCPRNPQTSHPTHLDHNPFTPAGSGLVSLAVTSPTHCQSATVHLDAGYDSIKTRELLDTQGLLADIARKGIATPLQAGMRWVVERSHSWLNG